MWKKNHTIILTFLFFLMIPKSLIWAGLQDISAVKAMQLFDAGNYGEAEKLFLILLNEEPGNPMLNYYYGASRTENGHFDEKDLQYLQNAGKNITPDRLYYYLGIQHHARNNWEQALKYYNMFRLSVPAEEQKELALAVKIQQCYDHINPFQNESTATENLDSFVSEENIQKVDAETDSVEGTKDQEVVANEFFDFGRERLPDLPGVKYSLPPGIPIKFQINNNITYLHSSQFRTEEGKAHFEKWQSLQGKLQNTLKIANNLRKAYSNTKSTDEKKAIGDEILSMEMESYSLKDEANQYYSAARNAEMKYWNQANPIDVKNYMVEQEKVKSALIDTKSKPENETVAESEKDTTQVLIPDILTELYDSSPNKNQQDNQELVYKIQIGAFSRKVPDYIQKLYNKLSYIRKIENFTDENGVVVYTTGNLTNLDDARKMQNQIKQEGIEDAIVAPYFNGKRITLEQAKKIEAGL